MRGLHLPRCDYVGPTTPQHTDSHPKDVAKQMEAFSSNGPGKFQSGGVRVVGCEAYVKTMFGTIFWMAVPMTGGIRPPFMADNIVEST